MSSPISRTESPSLDEHKRKREELTKKPEGASTSEIEGEGDVEAVPPKKIKPEVDASETVSRAEVKQIQRNLKTMPLEDSSKSAEESKDMDDVESDVGSPEDGAQDKQMESSSQPTPIKADTPDESQPSPPSDQECEQTNDNNGKAKTTDHTTTTTSGSQPKLGSRFNNTSSASPFANVKAGTNVFGSSSSTLQGTSATSSASPFANVDKNANVFGGSQPSAFSRGFENTSSVSPFVTMAAPTNVFGGESAKDVFGGESTKSVFGQGSSTTTSTFGGSAFGGAGGGSPESTSGSIFGTQSVVGSVAGAKSSSNTGAKFTPASQTGTTSNFSTFGAKNTFGGKEGGFGTGSFMSQEGSQEQADFGDLLSQDNQDKDDDAEQPEESERTFGAGVFSNVDQIDVQTGEENEMTIFQTKGKLYADTEKTHSWKERGKGTFKVNVGRRDTKLARLVMRTDGVLRLILNVSIFPEMNVTITGDKYIRFMGVEEGAPLPFLLKVRGLYVISIVFVRTLLDAMEPDAEVVKDAATAEEVVQNINRAAERQVKGKGQGVVLRD
ncbi:hypothetical protein EC957_008569 [Mortierella hygrophila]|uniref:RanBD1 domain-containing protein n=1 Tax=Mortierella hygrophila TaxID=979708 RepID=A0A9P6FC36_9FUNG|nr:hypothetical protein EC957_008569 [Mortierella hygrophila]